jgi:hypothetical protein
MLSGNRLLRSTALHVFSYLNKLGTQRAVLNKDTNAKSHVLIKCQIFSTYMVRSDPQAQQQSPVQFMK